MSQSAPSQPTMSTRCAMAAEDTRAGVRAARKMGIKVFAWLLSVLTASRITDPACGYRAVRTQALRGLEFHQDQFHNSEFILEASKKKLRTQESPSPWRRGSQASLRSLPTSATSSALQMLWCVRAGLR